MNKELFYVLAKVAIERKLAIAINPTLRGAAVARRVQMETSPGVSKGLAKSIMSGPLQQETENLARKKPGMFTGKGGQASQTVQDVKELAQKQKLNPKHLAEKAKARGF